MTNRQASEWSASVSHDRCVGIGICALTSPGGFDFDDTGLAVFQPNGKWTPEELTEAAHGCPSSAIDIFRHGEKQP